MTRRAYPSLVLRLFAHSTVDPETDCWIWIAHIANGYGRLTMRVNGSPYGCWAHRVAYETFSGRKIARGMTLEHTCRKTLCINPHHLIEVTREENTRLMQMFRKNAAKRYPRKINGASPHAQER